MLKTVAFLHGHKWTSMMVKRVYFGNWLRDYSQAMDVGTLKSVQADTIRILVWVLSYLTFGYATEEFEVTSDRLGVYKPEEHIDNPKDYADNQDARQYDPRLRPPIQPIELAIDPNTGMKNYISNDSLGIATSSGYIRFSFARSIHYGRVYTNGSGGTKGKETDLCEALRCLGQALHTMEDFGAHTNYVELTLREMGYRNVFPHTGSATEMDLRGHRAFPLVTGTFGMVDFIHSVLGEATDHFAQSEVEELNKTLADAQANSSGSGSRSFGDSGSGSSNLTGLLSQVPGAGSLCQQAEQLQETSRQQEHINVSSMSDESGLRANQPQPTFAAPPGSEGGPPGPGIPGMSPNFDPAKTIKQIYPILEFRDKVVKMISATIEKIPGLEALVEKITETLTMFILSLLAPFIRPIIEAVSKQLKSGSSTVVDASGKHQYEPWTDPHCTDPTHSLLSKDHFSNILNEPAGQVAAVILQYVAPRIIYAWQHPDVPVDQVLDDVVRVFHHPALRDRNCEIHNTMFSIVEKWARSRPSGGSDLDHILSSESVRNGKNSTAGTQSHGQSSHSHGLPSSLPSMNSVENTFNASLSSRFGNVLGPLDKLKKFGQSSGLSREGEDFENEIGTQTQYDSSRPPTGPDYPQAQFQGQSFYQGDYSQQHQYQGSYQQHPYQGGPPPQQYGYGPQEGDYQQDYNQYQGNPPPSRGYYEGPPPPQQGGYYDGRY